MILTCPNCASRFLLSAQALAPDGRRVKCSSCAEEWFQLPDPDELVDNVEHEIEEIPESVKPIPEGSSVPALPEESEGSGNGRTNLAGYIGAAIIFLGILGGLAVSKDAVLKAWLPSAAFYQMIGISVVAPGEGLVFDKIKATLQGHNKIVVEGFIINLTDKTQNLPVIEISIRNEAGGSIQKNLSPPPFAQMPPKAKLPFKSTHTGNTDEADHVQIRFVLGGEEASEETTDEAHHEEAKTVSEDADNTQALHADDHAEPHGAAAH